MRAVIITNPYFDAPQYVRQYTRIAEELRAAGCDAVVMRADEPDVSVDERTHVDVDADFCVYLDKDKYLSLLLERRGMRLFNSHAAIQACDDKMSTHALLSGHGIPMPLTVPASLCYTPGARATDAQLERVGRVLGFPVVVKSSYGSMGKGVYLAKDKAELRALADELASVPHLFQRFVAESAGRDLRVIVVGGKAVGGMLRSSETDFRSNVGAGGHGTPMQPSEEARDVAERAAAALGLDFCGVDLLFSHKGPMVCEVNSNAFFEEFERVTRVNVARAYALHMLSVMRGKTR